MQPVVSSEQMRWCDGKTIASYGIPGLILMDRAGVAAAHIILQRYGTGHDTAVVVSGKGNNGGDGFVIARTLAENGFRVHVVLVHPPSALHGDASTQFDILRKVGRSSNTSLTITSFSAFRKRRPPGKYVIVDALFGTGFQGSAKGTAARAIEWMRGANGPMVSVDIPSGIDGTDGTADGPCVSADTTITFGLIKSGLLLNEGREHSGHVLCVDIGIPSAVTKDRKLATFLVDRASVADVLPIRPQRLHKYSAGKVLLVAGSRGFTGAAALAAKGALRSGAGAAMLLTPENIYPILARKLTEEIVRPVRDTDTGTFGEMSMPDIAPHLRWADVLVVGPGISVTADTTRFLEKLLSAWKGPAVLDADALTIVAGSARLRSRMLRADWILTPHVGEFDRIVRVGSRVIEQQRIEIGRSFSRSHGCTLVLKGAPTCTSSPQGSVFVNSTGNPGMATVGSGDVLSGLIAGLRAQQLTSVEAAFSGVYLHGRAGDLARDILGERSVLAGDMLQYLPVALQECSR